MPGEPDPTVVDLYKLAVEMADRVSARRATANTYFASLQSAIIATLAFLTAKTVADRWVLVAVCVAGVLTSIAWYIQLRSYRDLNRAKFDVILALENALPTQVFTDEWAYLKPAQRSPGTPRYIELGKVDRTIPWVFVALNTALAIYLARK